ncbi:MAG: helicase associated domain-containing protein [Verrucomicrobia bacterium]|nr:helicase associated domain-containing protein [Verrucomicrobiota bacterium]
MPPAKDLKERIEALLAHKAEHGHLAVSQLDKNYPGLANWMTKQRRRLKNGTLPVEIKKRLDEIDFTWTPAPPNTDKQWFEMFERFKKYASANGASTVRVIDDETAKLNRWVLTQRRAKKGGQLSDARFRALDAVGFIWQRNKSKLHVRV